MNQIKLFIFLQIIFLSLINSSYQSDEKNIILIKVQSQTDKAVTYIYNIPYSYYSEIQMYIDDTKMASFDRKLQKVDGLIHTVKLIFPPDFQDTCAKMFFEMKNVLEIKFINFQGCTDTKAMFEYCYDLKDLYLEQFDTSLVTNMEMMFHGCKALSKLDLFNFKTDKVVNMNGMFSYCNSLSTINNLNVLDTSKVTNMGYLFFNSANLRHLDVSNFDTRNVLDMNGMFYNCSSLVTID